MKKVKSKIRIEEYQHECRRRSWAACQENDNSDSAYETYIEIRYRIMCGKKILRDGMISREMAEFRLKINYTVDGIAREMQKLNRALKLELKAVNKRYLIKLKVLDKQIDLINKLEG